MIDLRIFTLEAIDRAFRVKARMTDVPTILLLEGSINRAIDAVNTGQEAAMRLEIKNMRSICAGEMETV